MVVGADMSLSPSEVHELLDTRGLLGDSHGPGTYAVKVETPDSREEIAQAWREYADVLPPGESLERLAGDHVAYVGASSDVYGRLEDHARGEVRQASLLRVFDLVGLVGVWPNPAPFDAEYSRALELSRYGWVCWTDGSVVR